MAEFVLRLKTKSGQQVLSDLKSYNTIADLKKLLSSKCNIREAALRVLSGFPPKQLDLNKNAITLQESGINSGDTLIVEEKLAEKVEKAEKIPTVQYEEQIGFRGLLLRQVVPADNSCLFTSVSYGLSRKIDPECGPYMRELIAEHVKGDPEVYNEGILGKTPAEYCDWILKPDSWGGAIELSCYGEQPPKKRKCGAKISRYPIRIYILKPDELKNVLRMDTKTYDELLEKL